MRNIDIETTSKKTDEKVVKRKAVVKGAKEGINGVRLSSNDQDIIEFMKDKGAFSSYVKKLIRAEIEREESSTNDSEIEDMNDKLNQILNLLQNTQIVSNVEEPFIVEDANQSEEEQEVYDNPNAHSFSQNMLGMISNLKK